MSIRETATEFHDRGFNCAQSVLCACGRYTGLTEDTALAVSCGFGGGLRCEEVCGAVSGGVMALGLVFPYMREGDAAAKDRIAELAKAYTAAFQARFGHLRCEQLKGDKSNCPVYIEYAAELAEKMIQETKNGGREA